MMSHPSLDSLSAYLDEELVEGQSEQLQHHLETCPRCRSRLRGLRGVVQHLEALKRQAPPPNLGYAVRRLTVRSGREPGILERLEREVGRFTLHSAVVPVFAVVMSLILIIYLLSWGVHRQGRRGMPVVFEPEGKEAVAVLSDGDEELFRTVAGRAFERQGELWVEQGLEAEEPSEKLAGTDPRVEEWFERNSELEDLQRLGGVVRLRLEGQIVEINFALP